MFISQVTIMPFLLVLLLVAFTAPFAHSEVINVPDDFQTIQAAIDNSENGDVVLVAEGTYNESIEFNGRNIVVGSQFINDDDEDHITETIIDGTDLDNRCVTFENGETEDAVLIGFTITNGEADYGAGIYIRECTPTLSNLMIVDNVALRHGGGIYCTQNGNPTISNVQILNNSASHPDEDMGYGAGLDCRDASPILINSVIAYNDAERYGGGIYCTGGGEPVFDHVTIFGNEAGVERGGIHFREGAVPIMVSSIHFGNNPPDISEGMDASYSDFEEGYDGDGNINANPLLADPDNYDFHLIENSPCIDAGNPDDDPDPDETRSDMGAFYYHQHARIDIIPAALDFGELNLGLEAELTLLIRNRGAVDLSVEQMLIVPEDAPFTISAGDGQFILADGEEHEVTIMFRPDDEDVADASLRIFSNDPDDPQLDVPLTGRGLPPVPNINVQPDFIVFDFQVLQQFVMEFIQISNTGEIPLIISDLIIEGDELVIEDGDGIFYAEIFEGDDELEPGEEAVVAVIFSPSRDVEYSAVLQIHSNDPDEGIVEVRLTGEGMLPPMQFDPANRTGVNHSVMITDVILDEEELDYGSQIAVFSPRGICCGADLWLNHQLGLAAWGDNEITEEIDGFEDGDEMTFVIWDVIDQEEYPCQMNIVQGDEIYQSNGVTVLELAGLRDGDIPDRFIMTLTPNWNMVSAPIIVEDDDVIGIWGGLGRDGNLEILKDFTGRFYNPEFDFCNIPRWDFCQGYQAKMDEAAELEFVGEEVADDHPVPLRAGWSIIAYFPRAETDAITAFENIVDNLTIAKDAFGNFYLPEFEFTNMRPLVRGQGYQVRVEEAGELIWNTGDNRLQAVFEEVKHTEHYTVVAPTGNNMSLLINSGIDMPDNAELAAYTASGLLAGTARLNGEAPWGLAVWGDDPTTENIDGAENDSQISLKLWIDGAEYYLSPNWLVGDGAYDADSYGMLEIQAGDLIPDQFALFSPYPNPFNNTVKIAFSLPEVTPVSLTIHDLLGREVSRQSLNDLTAGIHQFSWNAAGMPSGVYIFRVNALGKTLSVKAALIQ